MAVAFGMMNDGDVAVVAKKSDRKIKNPDLV